MSDEKSCERLIRSDGSTNVSHTVFIEIGDLNVLKEGRPSEQTRILGNGQFSHVRAELNNFGQGQIIKTINISLECRSLIKISDSSHVNMTQDSCRNWEHFIKSNLDLSNLIVDAGSFSERKITWRINNRFKDGSIILDDQSRVLGNPTVSTCKPEL